LLLCSEDIREESGDKSPHSKLSRDRLGLS
jgi:hypothetical protein